MNHVPIESATFFVGKAGDGIISFGSGQPDLPPPKAVFDVLQTYNQFKYGLVQGQVNLRTALAAQYPNATADHFVITNGASEALDLTLRVIKYHGGKKVLLPRPYYYSYPHNVIYAGMEPIYYDLVKGKIDLDDFAKKLDQCETVLINSPSNPTGSVQDVATLKEIERLTQQKGHWVISDEVYKDLIYERENYLIQGEKVITVNSFSKTFAMCGYRVGYFWARDKKLVGDVVELKNHTSMNTNILAQEMAFAATKIPQAEVDQQIVVWKERRDVMVKGLEDLGLELWKPEGAFYVLPKIKNPTQTINELYYQHKVITYDGTWFGAPDRVRFSYALELEKIKEGLDRLGKYLKERKI